MKTIAQKHLTISLIIALCLVFAAAGTVSAADYRALQELNTVNTIFDVRTADPENAWGHLGLVLDTYKNENITNVAKNPDFVVVFMGPSVKLLTKDAKGFSGEEKQQVEKIAPLLKQLKDAGVKLEVCDVALDYFGVDKNSVLPELTRVGNGWISSIGYQNKGYALVPIY